MLFANVLYIDSGSAEPVSRKMRVSCMEFPGGIRRIPHHLRRSVGVGTQGEACAVMPRGAGQSFDVHPFFKDSFAKVRRKSWGRMCSAPMAFRTLSWAYRKGSGAYMVPVLGEGNIYGSLGRFLCSSISRSAACRGIDSVLTEFCVFGRPTTSPLDAVHLFCRGGPLVLDIQVSPKKRQAFASPQAGGPFQIACRQRAPLVCFHRVGTRGAASASVEAFFVCSGAGLDPGPHGHRSHFSCSQIQPGLSPSQLTAAEVGVDLCPQTALICRLRQDD